MAPAAPAPTSMRTSIRRRFRYRPIFDPSAPAICVYPPSMPSDSPKPLDSIDCTAMNRLSVKDIRPPWSALASIGSTMSCARLRHSQIVAPMTKPAISMTINVRIGGRSVVVLRRASGSRP